MLAPQHHAGESQASPSFAQGTKAVPNSAHFHLQTQLRTPQDKPQHILSDRNDLGPPVPALPQNLEE